MRKGPARKHLTQMVEGKKQEVGREGGKEWKEEKRRQAEEMKEESKGRKHGGREEGSKGPVSQCSPHSTRNSAGTSRSAHRLEPSCSSIFRHHLPDPSLTQTVCSREQMLKGSFPSAYSTPTNHSWGWQWGGPVPERRGQ